MLLHFDFSTEHESAIDELGFSVQDSRAMKTLLVGFLLCGICLAADYEPGKLLDVQSTAIRNESALGRWARSDGGSMVIPDTKTLITMTVQLRDVTYIANFTRSRHLYAGAFIVGDPILVRIENDKMFIHGSDGKEVRGTIVRKERASETPSPAAAAH